MAQGDHGLHDGGIGRVVEHAAHKRLVHLEFVDFKPLQVGQAGVTGAKVVNGHQHPQRFQRRHLLLRGSGVVHQVGLGQLQLQPVGGHAAGLQHAVDLPHQLGVGQLGRRQVDRQLCPRQPPLLAPGHPLAAGLLQHPQANGHDQPGFFGQGNEVARGHVAQHRVVPPQQGLGPGQAARTGIQAGLVMQAELTVGQGFAQLRLHVLAGQHALVGFGGEKPGHVTPGGLGLVHGGIGAAHQLFLVGGIARVQGHPHTARHVQFVPLHHRGFADGGYQPFVDDALQLVGTAHVAQQHHKLIAAQAADGVVGPHGLGQAVGHGAQQAVTDVVAQGVVHELEAVQVDEQDRHLFARDGRLRQRLAQALLAQRAVGQLGQHVVLRQKADALFFGLAVGDVDGNANEVAHLPAGGAFAHHRHHQPRRVTAPRLAADAHLALPGVFLAQGGPFGPRAVQQAGNVVTDHLVELVGRAAAKRLVHADDLALRVHDDDALGRSLEHLGPQLQPLLHHLQQVDGGERGQHRVAPLVGEAAGRQHRPRRLGPAQPAHLEFVHRTLVGEALEKAVAHRVLQPVAPGVAGATGQPRLGGHVGVQHLVVGHRGQHHGNGKGLQQLQLGGGGTGTGGQLLLHQAVAVELGQHVVERGEQAANFVAAVPLGTAGVIGAAPHVIGHRGQVLQGFGNLAGHHIHQAQNAGQQRQRGAQVQPHAGKQAVHTGIQQSGEFDQAGLPGGFQRHQAGAVGRGPSAGV